MTEQVFRNKPKRLSLAQALCMPLPPLIAQRVRNLVYPISLGRTDDYSFRARSRTGSWFTGDTYDSCGHSFSVQGYNDWRVVAIGATFCREGDAVLEIGAHVGTETVAFSDFVGERGRVVAFEPFPQNADALERAAQGFQHRNVTVHRCAVTNKRGTARFSAPRARRLSSTGHLAVVDIEGDSIPVECVALDDLHNDLGVVAMMAIDVEGAEPDVLDGARALIGESRSIMVIEAIDRNLKLFGSSIEELRRTLVSMGYDVAHIDRWGLRDVRLDVKTGYYNWLCLPLERKRERQRANIALKRAAAMPCIRRLNPICRPASA